MIEVYRLAHFLRLSEQLNNEADKLGRSTPAFGSFRPSEIDVELDPRVMIWTWLLFLKQTFFEIPWVAD